MIPEWFAHFFGGSLGGGLLTAIITKLLTRRKDTADASKVEAETLQALQLATRTANEMAAAASAEIEKARKDGTSWYDAMIAVQRSMEARVAEVRAEHAAELASLRRRNEELTTTVASMVRQIEERTHDRAEVEWARLRNVEYEAMKAELVQLRAEVEQIPHLRAEVARLTILLEDEQRQARANEELLRKNLTGGTDAHG
jgi:chromosome segregation ATPase